MNAVAVNPQGNFFSNAVMDPVLLHAALYLVALDYNMKTGVADSLESLYHGGEAVRAINEQLLGERYTDATMAAVALMANKEVTASTSQTVCIHRLTQILIEPRWKLSSC